jgi:predicted GH43/DUF377 family glycosyl hydrolase
LSVRTAIKHARMTLRPDPSRTVVRPFVPSDTTINRLAGGSRGSLIAERVLALDARAAHQEAERVITSLSRRHRDIRTHLQRRFEEINGLLFERVAADAARASLIAAYFLAEYSFEAAALFNPSIVAHPDQADLPPGTVRFIMSLRSIGEGHMSSVTFRTGRWSRAQGFVLDERSPYAEPPQIALVGEGEASEVRLSCALHQDISETVLFPVTDAQRQGVEDLRLVRFVEDGGSTTYLGTYTAFDGRSARSELLRAENFRSFVMQPLRGDGISKGMALFPHRLDGCFAMLGRCDNDGIWLLKSPDLNLWQTGVQVVAPRYPWEFFQIGNCGSPILIDEGWLVLTHGVGAVRNYCIGACLLDRDDPAKLLARTVSPLLEPSEKERDGYVPNVVYSCGAMVHDRCLLIPYGVADSFTSFATIDLDGLLAMMK